MFVPFFYKVYFQCFCTGYCYYCLCCHRCRRYYWCLHTHLTIRAHLTEIKNQARPMSLAQNDLIRSDWIRFNRIEFNMQFLANIPATNACTYEFHHIHFNLVKSGYHTQQPQSGCISPDLSLSLSLTPALCFPYERSHLAKQMRTMCETSQKSN